MRSSKNTKKEPEIKYVEPKWYFLKQATYKSLCKVWPVPYKAEIDYKKFL